MRKLFFLVFLCAAGSAMAQKIPNPKPFAKTITAEELKTHLYIVAGPEMEGRETATDGERKAAAYIEKHFREYGVQPGFNGSYYMPFPVYQDSVISSGIEVNGKAFKADEDFSIFPGTAATSTLLSGEVVYVGAGTITDSKNSYEGVDARGKVVLVFPAAPAAGAQQQRRVNPTTAIVEAAAKNGAAAILVVSPMFPRRASGAVGGLTTNAYRKVITPNLYYISENIAREIMGEDAATAKNATAASAKAYPVELKLEFRKETNKLIANNVLGVIEGTDLKDEYLVLTAHYDHNGKRGDSVIFYGADDDGSGTVAILELAQAFAEAKKSGKGPRRSILFMCVSGEEKGLWGSAYYGDNPVFPLEKTTANLNIDMIGRTDPERTKGDSSNYVYVVGDDKLSTDLRPISEAMNKKYTKMELDYKFNDPNDPMRIYFRSDHYNFARHGVPIIFYFNGTHADYHRPTDTPDKINYPLLAKRAHLIFYTAWEMANRNDMLKRDLTLEIPQR